MNVVSNSVVKGLTQTPDDFNPTPEVLKKIAVLYADVFADEPWKEYKKCSKDELKFGRGVGEVCPKCKNDLEDFYPVDQTVKNIAKEIGIAGSKLILFRDGNEDVYAAGWGFPIGITAFRSKYETSRMQDIAERALRSNLQGETFFYMSEIMVDEKVRRQGIATRITTDLLERANGLGLDMVVRTSLDSKMAPIAQKFSMVQIVKEGEDLEMEGRVLFLKKRESK